MGYDEREALMADSSDDEDDCSSYQRSRWLSKLAMRIQSRYRGHVGSSRFRRMRRSSQRIQRMVRGRVHREQCRHEVVRQVARRQQAATQLQAAYRTHTCQEVYRKVRAVKVIRTAYRTHVSTRKARAKRARILVLLQF